jgi:hypothetical protein
MLAHTRAIVAAAAYAFIAHKKVAGVHDHTEEKDLQIAAEARGPDLQGYDGDRATRFGCTLPELYDAGDETYVTLEIDGLTAKGYDRRSMDHYSLTVSGEMVQFYDYGKAEWFAFSIQVARP